MARGCLSGSGQLPEVSSRRSSAFKPVARRGGAFRAYEARPTVSYTWSRQDSRASPKCLTTAEAAHRLPAYLWLGQEPFGRTWPRLQCLA
jgi:hypothetical protein